MTTGIVLSKIEYDVVGKTPIRHDGYDKVTGKANYGADISLPGLLHGKILRSPYAHANVLSIDTSRAEAHPDVKAVVTAGDLACADGWDLGDRHLSNKILATGKVVFRGHPVAAVAATTPHGAEEALSLIDVEYEVLPALTDAEEAMKPGAPQVHPEYEGNVTSFDQSKLGDIDKGFAEADVVVEREFRTKTVHQGYIEPHSATAWWAAEENKITLWCSSQGHFQIGESTAQVLGLASSQVKVVPMEIGGGFGGKTTIYLEPVAALLSKKSGQPVKLTMTRAEVLEASGPTSGSYMKVKMGATKDGKLTAGQASLMFEAGGYRGLSCGRRDDMHVHPLRPGQPAHRRLRRDHEQAQDDGVPGPRSAHRLFRVRDARRRDMREDRHGPAGVPGLRTPPKRGRGGSPARSTR